MNITFNTNAEGRDVETGFDYSREHDLGKSCLHVGSRCLGENLGDPVQSHLASFSPSVCP
jgi:hypothetical protein